MTIANASAITAADMNAAVTTALGLVQADNAQVPGVCELHLVFPGVVTGTLSYKRKATFVAPFDCYVEVLAVYALDQTAASTVKGAVTGDGTVVDDLTDGETLTDAGKLVFWPIKRAHLNAGAGSTNLVRMLNDGTKGKPSIQFALVNRTHRTILKGSTITVSVMTTSVATASNIQACLVLRQFFARD